MLDDAAGAEVRGAAWSSEGSMEAEAEAERGAEQWAEDAREGESEAHEGSVREHAEDEDADKRETPKSAQVCLFSRCFFLYY